MVIMAVNEMFTPHAPPPEGYAFAGRFAFGGHYH